MFEFQKQSGGPIFEQIQVIPILFLHILMILVKHLHEFVKDVFIIKFDILVVLYIVPVVN